MQFSPTANGLAPAVPNSPASTWLSLTRLVGLRQGHRFEFHVTRQTWGGRNYWVAYDPAIAKQYLFESEDACKFWLEGRIMQAGDAGLSVGALGY
ncbi:MAG: hypothetical protein AAF289_21315 [Cyanobacteria bacterium P01_A01_bin.135]